MSWVSDSTKNNQYAFQAADSQFEKNINTPMMNKYQGSNSSGGKQRMAGDYLSEFTNQFSDNSKVKEVTSKDYRGDTKNKSVSSFLGNSAPGSNSNANNQNQGKEMSSMPVPDQQPKLDEFGKAYKPNSPGDGPTTKASGNLEPTKVQTQNTLAPPKSGGKYYENKAEVKAAWNAEYDEDQYRYYESKHGSGTGADAYHTDMANYQAQMEWSKNSIAGPHMGLVNQMMHPDWQDHNYNGTYGEINQNPNYSTMPTGAAYGPGGKKEGLFGGGSGGNKQGQAKNTGQFK